MTPKTKLRKNQNLKSGHVIIEKNKSVNIPKLKDANTSSLYSSTSIKVINEAFGPDSPPTIEFPGDDDILFTEILSRTKNILRDAISQLPLAHRKLSEADLLKSHKFTDTLYLLRSAFWELFNNIQDGETIIADKVCRGICKREKMMDMLMDPYALAFFLCPPVSYTAKLKLLLEKGLERMNEVLSLPLVNKGVVDVKVISEIIKVVSTVDNRIHGTASQNIKINQTNKNLNLNVSSELPISNDQGIDQELLAIDKEILLLSDTRNN